jgi:hypothetical protein
MDDLSIPQRVEDLHQIALAGSLLQDLESSNNMNSPAGTVLHSQRDCNVIDFRLCRDLAAHAQIQSVMKRTGGYCGRKASAIKLQ